jgi:hypothetical protein
MPSLPARNLLALAGLSLLWTALGCKLGVSDVVRRSPEVGSGTGGSSGQDLRDASPAANDLGPWISPRIDGDNATYDAVVTGENETEAGPKNTVADTRSFAGPDSVSEAGGMGKVSGTCMEDGYQFCEGFEDGAARWAMTSGSWSLSEMGDGSETNMVFGPTDAVPGIAFVPTTAWQDMTVEARVMVTSFDQPSSTNRVVLYARYQDITHFYAVALRGDGKLGLRRNGTAFGTVANVSVAVNEWHVLKLRVSGSADNGVVEGSLDGTLLVTATDTSGSMTSAVGTVGLGVYGGALAVFDDIKVSSP